MIVLGTTFVLAAACSQLPPTVFPPTEMPATAIPEPVSAQTEPAQAKTTAPPTPVPTPTPPMVVPPVEPLRAWAVAASDGAVFVLDATHSIYQLAPDDLAPLTRSSPLFGAVADAPAYVLAGETHLFVGSTAITQTLVLRRDDFSRVTALGRAGPVALDPGKRLFMISDRAIWAYDVTDLSQPPVNVAVDPAFNPNLGYGSIPRGLVADPGARQLYVRFYDQYGSPPHNPDSYRIFDLDTLAQGVRFNGQLGSLTRPAVAERAGLIVATHYAKSGFFGSKLAVFDRKGQELKGYSPLDGVPATDADGNWIYLLRERGLWVLRESDLSLQSLLPFTGTPPADLALSPDGEMLYLFGNGWLAALSTAELQALGIPPVRPFPAAWTYPDLNEYYQPRFYPSPQIEEDGVAFVEIGGYGEVYRTTDGGHSWHFSSVLNYPDFHNVQHFSFSPDFARDRTLTALPAGIKPLLRSTDGGDSWEEWTPRIAFVSDRNGDREIYTMNQEGSNLRRITDSPAAEENPAWSPAWTRLAFQSDRNGNWDIFTVRSECDPRQPETSDGCDQRQLTNDPADDLLPAWSPDGRSIAFVSTRDGNPEIYVMDSDGQHQRRLTFNPSGDWRPAWMPDSHQLAFTSDRSGNNDIYLLEVPPSDASPLTREPELTSVVADPADDRDPALSGNGRLLFLSDRDGVMRAYTLDLRYSYSQAYPAADTQQPEAHPAWIDFAGGYAILVTTERDGQSDVHRVVYPAEYTPLAPSPSFDGHPAWGAVWWTPEASASQEWLKEHGGW